MQSVTEAQFNLMLVESWDEVVTSLGTLLDGAHVPDGLTPANLDQAQRDGVPHVSLKVGPRGAHREPDLDDLLQEPKV